jgi:S-adenosylmethionine:diacylglycerol 3-amino-3-carboxypropyl transferase
MIMRQVSMTITDGLSREEARICVVHVTSARVWFTRVRISSIRDMANEVTFLLSSYVTARDTEAEMIS